MKKTLSIIMASLICAGCCSATAFAANEADKSTQLSYVVASNYTITISPTVTITDNTCTDTVKVNANSLIEAGKTLKFKITGATNYDASNTQFRLKNGSGTDVYLNYDITKPGTPDAIAVGMNTAFLEATAAEAYAGKSVELTYTTGTAQSAGVYTDTLTFSIGVE